MSDYRKRAEEFCKKHFGPWVNGLDTDNLARAFQQIAQEARREENEACLEIIEYYKKNFNNFNVEDLLESIRSRWRESD